MLSNKIKEYLSEHISQEVYVQVAVTKGKEKITTKAAIFRYFESNHIIFQILKFTPFEIQEKRAVYSDTLLKREHMRMDDLF